MLTTGSCPKLVMLEIMTVEAQMLTNEEFTSLLAVGDARVNAALAISAAHSARLIALGYIEDLAGRPGMTTPGRIRIYAWQLAGN